ncbi:MAG: two component transcriptional regulator [uncultured bacterium (gcode 4)]|uniref:Two component transcriptional regulator n=1 Tax=uncultured bacterium (gcode 4) TaxID=1234023 RepID=K2ACT3_9BACT|nr:MAG: two component transcriptional regulator [uncultured bacterium (gcode 4)]
MKKILIIEDDIWILNSLGSYISGSGFGLSTCENWLEALNIFNSFKPNLVILDINLPGKNWIEICKEIRQISNIPIIILSARGDEEDKILALELWADDYVSKPFSPRELLARVNSVLKRFSNNKETDKSDNFLHYNNIELDLKNYLLKINATEIKTTKTEFLLLKYIIEKKDEVILRENLMKDIMGYDNYIYDRTIDTHIKNLRKKVGNEIEIKTLRWIWYKIGK